MRRRVWNWLALGILLSQGGFAEAQSSIDALEQELKDAKQQHQDVTSQVIPNFFSQIDQAMSSPEAAIALYQQAGGTMPDPTPVVTQNEVETVTEKDARLAKDQANLTRLGLLLQLHCGEMHFAALFVLKPDQQGLQDQWVAWLKTSAQLYAQLEPPSANDDQSQQSPVHHHRKRDGEDGGAGGGGGGGTPPPVPFNFSDIKSRAMHDSIISKFLGFKSWGDKEQGGWSVAQLPKLYFANVLTPLRTTPTAATLASWDVYIAMLNADEKDNDRWNQTVYPPLQFDKGCDAYAVEPDTEKLEALIAIIKANPTSPRADDWVSRVHQLMDDYRSHHGGASAIAQGPAPAAPTSDPNTSVTAVQDGDMTVITTKTNAPSATPPPAPAPAPSH